MLNCDCGSGKMKCAVKKMVGDVGLAGRHGSHKKQKNLSDEKLKICAKRVESGN